MSPNFAVSKDTNLISLDLLPSGQEPHFPHNPALRDTNPIFPPIPPTSSLEKDEPTSPNILSQETKTLCPFTLLLQRVKPQLPHTSCLIGFNFIPPKASLSEEPCSHASHFSSGGVA